MTTSFRWLLAGRTVDAIGNGAAPIALGFAALDLFGSPEALGVVVASTSLGTVLFLLAGGVAADRLPRSRVLVGSNLAAATTSALMALLVALDVSALWPLVVLGFLTGAAGAFDFPATTALVPAVVDDEDLERANGRIRLSLSISSVAGASVGGLAVAAVGPAATLAFNASTFVIAAFCYVQVAVPPSAETSGRDGAGTTTALQDLVQGWGEFVSQTWVWVVVVAFCVVNAVFAGAFSVLGLVVADDTFGRASWGFIVAAHAGGSTVGTLFASRLRVRRPLVLGMLATATEALPLIALAVLPYSAGDVAAVPLLIVVTAVAGALGIQFELVWQSALQRHIPRDRLARVSSIDALGSFAAIPIGQAAVGPLAVTFGAPAILLSGAALIVGSSLAPLISRDVRTLPGAR